jgi:hypothetical protein
MPANGPGITSFNLRLGVDEWLYNNIQGTGVQATFGVIPQSSNYRGVLLVQIVPIPLAGTLTSVVGQLEAALVPEVPVGTPAFTPVFGIFNKLANFGASPATVSAYSAIPFESTTNNIPIALDVSGLGGNGKMRFNFTTVTLGTATGFNVFARIG